MRRHIVSPSQRYDGPGGSGRPQQLWSRRPPSQFVAAIVLKPPSEPGISDLKPTQPQILRPPRCSRLSLPLPHRERNIVMDIYYSSQRDDRHTILMIVFAKR